MTADTVVDILRQALMMAFWVAGPLLLIGLVTGILVSLTQIVTSIQDSGFSTIPRLVIFLVAILLLMPWMIQRMTVYTAALLGDLGRYAR
jgi:flagellar biosynthetic protein FliQ